MGKQEYGSKHPKPAEDEAADLRERLVHRQLQWLVFWTCLFIAAGAMLGMQP